MTQILTIFSCAVENQRSLIQLEVNDIDKDVILVLQYLCEHLSCSHGQGGQAEPLLLEGILTLICKRPLRITDSEQFHDLVWWIFVLIRCNTIYSIVKLWWFIGPQLQHTWITVVCFLLFGWFNQATYHSDIIHFICCLWFCSSMK